MLILLAGVGVIAALESLYVWMPDLPVQTVRGGRLAMFDLTGPGSLGAWFSSLVLLAAAMVALVVYGIRRHKVDDYHGHYRIWLWAAMGAFLLATDAGASLHEGFRDIMTAATGSRMLGDGSVWWAIPAIFLLGAIGSRLLVDTWPCRLSSTALVLSTACYLTAFSAHFGWIWPQSPLYRTLLEQGAQMTGHLLLVLAMALFARYVIFDAEGLLPRRHSETDEAAQPKLALAKPAAEDEPADDGDVETQAEEPEEAAEDWVAIDPPHGKTPPVLKRVVAPAVTVEATPAPAPDSADQKLGKADRKALKKRLLAERLQREQKKSVNWGK